MNFKILLLTTISLFSLLAPTYAQNKPVNCLDDYTASFTRRGAFPVADGMQKVVVALQNKKKDTVNCVIGQIMVKKGAFVLPLYIVRENGTLTQAKGTLDYYFYRTTDGQITQGITGGMSALFYLKGDKKVRLFFIDFLKPEPGGYIGAPDLTAQKSAAPKQEAIEKINASAKAIQFETGKAVISQESYAMLDVIAELMNSNPDSKWLIDGYTDNKGNEKSNMDLSERRVEAVQSYLIKKGVHPDRLYASGHGQNDPIADNKTEEGRKQNRRVEIKPLM